jgi:endoglucanase
MANNKTSKSLFNTNAQIVEDWNGGYKLEFDLTANSAANNWKLDFSLPYKITAAYGVDLVDKGNGNYSIDGQNDQVNLKSGQTIKPIFIIDDGGKQAILPKFSNTGSGMTPKPNPVTPSKPTTSLMASPSVVEDWNGGYKLAVDLKASSVANNWKANFNLPYTIKEAYGVNLVNNGNGNYTISGQNDQVNLKAGQTIQPIFIINDGGKDALLPKFDSSVTVGSGSGSTPKPTPTDPVTIPGGEGKPVGQRGKFAYGEALQKNFLFYEANRSGDLGPDNRLEWRKDSTLKDGSTVGRDLEGGYFDAGDHVKFGQPMAASVNMLAWGGVEYKEAYKQSGQLDELLEAVKWGTDYFLKAHETSNGKTDRLWVQVGEGGSQNDHGYWGSPETVEQKTTRRAFAIDRTRPGTDVAASTSSALAAASMLFRGVDNAYADKLLNNAKQLYEFAETYQGKYSDSVSAANPFYTSWSGYGDELASGAAWLHKATGQQSYLTKAENYFKTKIGGLGDWSWAVDDHSYGAAVILAQSSKDSFFKGQVEGWLNNWINGTGSIKYTSGGFAHRAAWGSVPVTGAAAFLAELYNDTVKQDSRYSKFATRQVDYILGDNPKGFSYMVGFGKNYPQRSHHRGSAGSQPLDGGSTPNDHILYGAIVGGPGKADDYAHNDRRNDWITNEVGTSYNAPIASALIQQYQNLGGDPLSESQLDQLIGVDANGVGF